MDQPSGETMTSRYANGHRRRQLRARILAEETNCALCGKSVDKTLKTPNPWSPEIDEIIPFSLGGDPLSRANTQLTHRYCNELKGNGRHTTKSAVQPIQTTRTWT